MNVALALCLLPLLASSIQVDRVAVARRNKEARLRALAKQHHLNYPFGSLVLRAFKREMRLQLWAANDPHQRHVQIRSYKIAAASGGPGPKRREGDGQVPEGLYDIDKFNPQSNFHLSMRVAYPNKSDLVLGDREHPGSDIYVHGNEVSIGCLAMTDNVIEDLYIACLDSRTLTKRNPRILVLPFKDGAERDWPKENARLWGQLFAIDAAFERDGRLPVVQITDAGDYTLGR